MRHSFAHFSDENPSKFLKEILPKIKFKRNYLKVSASPDDEQNAKQKIEEFKILQDELSQKESLLKVKTISLQQLKPPKLFGKEKYQEQVDQINDEIRKINDEIQALRERIDKSRDEAQKSEELLERSGAERTEIDKKYNDDEAGFDKEKKAELAKIAPIVCKIPEDIVNAPWAEGIEFFKTLFRSIPEENIFPVIGWEYALPIASKILIELPTWSRSNESIIIEGEPKELRTIFDNFLWEYIHKDAKNQDDPGFHFMRSIVLTRKLETLYTVETLRMMKEQGYEMWSIKNVATGFPEIGELLRECYTSMETAKKGAIENSDETLLNSILKHEKHVNDSWGFMKESL